jgi:hypothetical protein
MNLKKNIGTVVTSKFVGTGPSFYKQRIYRAAVSKRLRNTGLSRSKFEWNIAVKNSTGLILVPLG